MLTWRDASSGSRRSGAAGRGVRAEETRERSRANAHCFGALRLPGCNTGSSARPRTVPSAIWMSWSRLGSSPSAENISRQQRRVSWPNRRSTGARLARSSSSVRAAAARSTEAWKSGPVNQSQISVERLLDALLARGEAGDLIADVVLAARSELLQRCGEERRPRAEVVAMSAARDAGAIAHAPRRRALVAVLHEALQRGIEQGGPRLRAALLLGAPLALDGGAHPARDDTYIHACMLVSGYRGTTPYPTRRTRPWEPQTR